MTLTRIVLVGFLLLIGLSCNRNQPSKVVHLMLTDSQIANLSTKRILFGHQSVGGNIVRGLSDLEGQYPALHLKTNNIDNRQPTATAGLFEFHVGANGDPASKDAAFSEMLDRTPDGISTIALYKYCFVDIIDTSDVKQIFETFQHNVLNLQTKHPQTTFVIVTVPLTTVEPWWKAKIKRILGRQTMRDANLKRNQFNELLRHTYQGKLPIFDLAEAESTKLDGSRAQVTVSGYNVYVLAPEYASDTGHLNELGRRVTAAKLLAALVNL